MNGLYYFAKGGGGGRAGGGAKSAPKSSPSTNNSTKSQQNSSKSNEAPKSDNKASASPTPSTPAKPSARPSKDTQKTTTATKPSTQSTKNKKYSNEGNVVNDKYQPHFNNGYTPPANSTVYYPQHNFTDYLLLGYLFSQNSPRNDEVVVVQPDGKEVVAKPENEGIDGLAVFNWIFLIIILVGIVFGGWWGYNKFMEKRNKNKGARSWKI